MLGRRASRLAPPRHVARGGSPPRCAAWSPAPLPVPLSYGPVAVGRDVPIAPPRRMARCAAWPPAPLARAPWSGPVARSRCGRARCPHRAAAPSVRCAALPPAARRRAPLPRHIARGGSPPRCAAWPPAPVAARTTPAHPSSSTRAKSA